MTEAQKKAQETRRVNSSMRKEREAQRAQEQSILRKRLLKIIEAPETSDREALQAITLLHDLDEKSRGWK